MAKQPDYIKEYLRDIPVNWDESRFLSGYPGKDVAIARRKDETWHVVGINGENMAKEIMLDLSFIEKGKTGILISDDEEGFTKKTLAADTRPVKIELGPNEGFVMKF